MAQMLHNVICLDIMALKRTMGVDVNYLENNVVLKAYYNSKSKGGYCMSSGLEGLLILLNELNNTYICCERWRVSLWQMHM